MKEGDNLAITKIWAVKDDLNRVFNYIKNPDKTTELGDGLKEVLAYTTQGYKTNEKEYITGINCDPKTSLKQMMNTKLSYNKMDGRLAFHAVQSFKPGEVTPKKCHALGVQLAKQMWGNRFEVVVSTHLDKEHLHNHFVINSVSWVDGMKYDNRKSNIDHFCELNDAICKEHGLSIIENPSIQNMTFEERFESMVIKEYDSRINHTVERYIKNARFYDSNATLQDINYKPDREINRGLIEELSTNEYIQQKLNIILIGASGSGKTWISNAFEVNACMERYRVQYTRLPDLFQEIEEAKIQGHYKKYMKKLSKVDLLILDEFLLTTISECERNDLFEVIQSRTDKKSTIYCSQWAPEGWLGKLGDGPLADAILDRIRNSSYTILLKGRFLREDYSKIK